jgi:hypothetical protein
MKKTLLFTLTFLMMTIIFGQTATNFNCNDCSGENHDLFAELDAGKVIVICWVMPCGSCVVPSLTTSNVVKSFSDTHPGKVSMYLVDDFANTNCTSLNSWASSNNINYAASFSNPAISMLDYGSPGMPKVVVIGDVSHTVYYNANNSVNATALLAAINAAINATLTGINENDESFASAQFYPNPSSTISSLVFSLEKQADVRIEIFDHLGKIISERTLSNLPQGKNDIEINTNGLDNGIYFVKLSDGYRSRTMKFAVVH